MAGGPQLGFEDGVDGIQDGEAAHERRVQERAGRDVEVVYDAVVKFAPCEPFSITWTDWAPALAVIRSETESALTSTVDSTTEVDPVGKNETESSPVFFSRYTSSAAA